MATIDEIRDIGVIGDPAKFGITVSVVTYDDGKRFVEVEVFGPTESQSYYIDDLSEIESLIGLLQRGKDHIQNG